MLGRGGRRVLAVVSVIGGVCLTAASVAGQGGGFAPVPLPDPGIPGYRFPEPEPTILGWAAANDTKAMASHAWGVWTALTMKSGQRYEGQELLVFETWQTPGDLLASPARGLAAAPRNPRPLALPHQFFKSARPLAAATGGQQTVLGFVKYDPTAARHIQDKNLFSKAALQAMLPDKAVMLADWPGPPTPPKAFGSTDWGRCVWIDIQDQKPGPGSGAVDTACKADGSSRTPATTYGVGQFIKFRMSPAAIKSLASNRRLQALARAATGDYAVLVAMHVTTREMKQWTWETFWWSPRPADPPLPSGKAIADARPSQLEAPAANYAHCTAYSTLFPPQPNTGGQNVGESVYCYNPWLEAGFDPSVLPDSQDGMYQGKVVKNDVGVQTNCMSCHAQANYAPGTVASPPKYTGDRYVDLNGAAFTGTLKVDFLWSIPGNAQ